MTDLPNKALLRPDEVAAYFRVKVRVIYKWVDEGRIRGAVRVAGRTIRIPRESVVECQKNVEDEGVNIC
jgi:excisionase family DNA binding protein